MLIIARRKGQRILIGDDVEVIVTELSKGTVKLGIVAPTQTTILRGETKDVADANRAAMNTSLDLLPGPGPGAVDPLKPTKPEGG